MLPVDAGDALLPQTPLPQDAQRLSVQRHIGRAQESALEPALLGPLPLHLAQFFSVALSAALLLAEAVVDHGDQLARFHYLVGEGLPDLEVARATALDQSRLGLPLHELLTFARAHHLRRLHSSLHRTPHS